MEKINLNAIATKAVEERARKERERTQKFVENQVIPQLVGVAERGGFFADIHIPADQNIELVLEILAENVDCQISRNCRMVNIVW